MDPGDGFAPIEAVFFALFHPEHGAKVVHQVPYGAVTPQEGSDEEPLFDFNAVKNYVVPKPELCNKSVAFKIGRHKVLGYPVHVPSPNYARNSFIFNLCFVFASESDTAPYEGNIKRIGRMFRALEEQSQLLSLSEEGHEVFFQQHKEPDSGQLAHQMQKSLVLEKRQKRQNRYLKVIEDWEKGSGQVAVDPASAAPAPGQSHSDGPKSWSLQSLIEQMYQDLNNYSECQIPIDSANSVDIKLFPIFSAPPNIDESDVPLATVKLGQMVDDLWDPTMKKVIQYIDGINSVHQISALADVDFNLTRECIQQLVQYRSVALLDIFQFSNVYAPTAQVGRFLTEPMMAEECQSYVVYDAGFYAGRQGKQKNAMKSAAAAAPVPLSKSIPSHSSALLLLPHPRLSPHTKRGTSLSAGVPANFRPLVHTLPSKAVLFDLYRSLDSKVPIMSWCLSHRPALKYIDVRRFIMFGVLRGIIYRVRAYPVILFPGSKMPDEFKQAPQKSSGSRRLTKTKNYNMGALPFVDSHALDTKKKRRASMKQLKKLGILGRHSSEDAIDDDKDNDDDDSEEDSHTRTESLSSVMKKQRDHGSQMAVRGVPVVHGTPVMEKERQWQKDKAELKEYVAQVKDLDLICTKLQRSRDETGELLSRLGTWRCVDA